MSAVRPVNTGKMQDLIFKAAKTADYWSGITVLWGIGLITLYLRLVYRQVILSKMQDLIFKIAKTTDYWGKLLFYGFFFWIFDCKIKV